MGITATASRKPKHAREIVRAHLVKSSLPERQLTVREFAETHVMLPKTSPFGNVSFRCDRQPYSGLLFDEIDSGRWMTIIVGGPSQSGKTLSAFVIPILRDVKELGLNTIAAFPEADMASDKWDTDFRPTLEDSPDLRALIPETGPGSRGGRIRDRVSLGNKVDIKIMTRGGDDTALAGYTSPRVYATEAAGWSHSTETSVEANPLRQLRARMKAFKRTDKRRLLLVEGTLTVAEELPYIARGADDDEKLISSRSRLLSDCPHCGGWISPGREDLVGWQQAESEDEAADKARFLCPLCKKVLTDAQRRRSMANLRLVHHGQRINKHGEVVGRKPPTSTLWFHWQAWHNLLRDPADFGAAEWEAQQTEEGTEERENAEKELCQFDFSVPFKSTLSDQEPLKATEIRKRCDQWKRNVLPHDTAKVTVGIDIGDWTGWPFVFAHRNKGQRHVPSYGAFDVKRNKEDDLESRIVASLHDYADNVIEQGFPHEGTDGLYIPDIVWIDGGYMPEAVARFIRERGGIKQKRYHLVRGRGRSTNNGGYRQPRRTGGKILRIGKQWYQEINYDRKIKEITFNADYWKLALDASLKGEYGRKGATTFFYPELKHEHAKVSNHLANEQFKKEWKPGKGLVEGWVVTGDQHWKDAAAMGLAAGSMAGINLLDIEEPPASDTENDNFYSRMKK